MTHAIRIAGTDVAFTAAPAETVLDAALRQGIELPYSCRKGVCENCLGRLQAGELVAGTGGAGPSAGACGPDEHLFCRARPASDLVIAPRSWSRIDPDARRTFAAKVLKAQRAADDVTVLQLRFPAGERARFEAGQYLEILGPDGRRRAFSMANPPHENDGVLLHIRHLPGGAFTSGVVPGLQKGDVLQVTLPFGDFRLRDAPGRPLLFIAGGTGFAPIKSIIDHLIRQSIDRPVTLFWGAREPQGLYALPVVEKWLRQRPDLRFEPVISGTGTPEWTGRRGRLPSAVLDALGSVDAYDVYACGSTALIRSLRDALTERGGLRPDRFFSDAFVA